MSASGSGSKAVGWAASALLVGNMAICAGLVFRFFGPATLFAVVGLTAVAVVPAILGPALRRLGGAAIWATLVVALGLEIALLSAGALSAGAWMLLSLIASILLITALLEIAGLFQANTRRERERRTRTTSSGGH